MTSQAISTKKRTVMMIVLLAGAFVALLAETFLNNAIPTIMSAFQVTQSSAQWLTTAYLLVVGLMIPLSAWIFESFNLRQNYLTMIGIFFIGSLICVFAPNFGILLTGRIIEAVAAGGLMPFIQNVILMMFPPEKRGMAMGITGLVIGFGPAIGPTISGVILQYSHWQMLFIILSALSALIGVVAIFTIGNLHVPNKQTTDMLSFLESIIGFGLLLYALSEVGNTGKVTPLLAVLFIIGLVTIYLFGRRQLQLPQPLLDIRVFKNIQFDICTLLSMISNIAMVSVELVLPLYIQTTRDETALTSGLIMMPGAIVMMICNPVSGILYDKLGIKKLSLFGFGMLILGTFPMLMFDTTTSLLVIGISYAVRMVGISFTMMTTFTAAINAVQSDLTAHANAASSTLRQVGGSFGTAISMLIVTLTITLQSHMPHQIALEHGFYWAFILMIGFALIGLLASLFLPAKKVVRSN